MGTPIDPKVQRKILVDYNNSKVAQFLRLDDATSRHLLHIINCCYEYEDKMSNIGDLQRIRPDRFVCEIFSSFKEWRTFLYYLGTYICEITELHVLRVMCSWALIALAYIERKGNPNNDKTTMDIRDMQAYDTVYKILCYTCRQHGSSNIRWFFSVFGDEFFDQVVGLILIDPSFNAQGFLSYLSVLAIAMNPSDMKPEFVDNEASVPNTAVATTRPFLLKEFFNDHMLYILPRLVFNPDVVNTVKELIAKIAQTMEITSDELLKNNFIYIVDYQLRKVPSIITVDTALRTYATQHPSHFYVHRSSMTMFIGIFNLSVNEQGARDIIKTIVDYYDESFDQWMELKFLGVLLHIRHYVLFDKFFLRRKREFAASFTILLNMLKSSLLHRFAAKIFQTLWLINSEVESFKDCWLVLIDKLDTKILLKYSSRILFYTSQLNEFHEVAFAFLNKISTCEDDKKTRDGIVTVLHKCYDIGSGIQTEPLVVAQSALEIVKEAPHLSYEVLPKVFDDLNYNATKMEKKLELLDSFLPLVGHLKCVEEVSVIGSCLGQVGAISPIYLSGVQIMSLDHGSIQTSPVGSHLLFEGKMLVNELVGKCLSWFTNNDNSTQSDMVGFALQCIAKEIEKLPTAQRDYLNKDLKRELSPFLSSTFALNKVNGVKELPLIGNVRTHDEWIVEWFCKLSGFVKRPPFTLLHCLTLSHIDDENPTIFADFLPLLILCCLIDMKPDEYNTLIYKEMVAVFSSVGLRADIKDSCQFIFAFFAGVEKHFNAVLASASLKDKLLDIKKVSQIFFKLKKEVISAKTKEEDKFPASVLSAIACSNYYSALEILEKYVVKKERAGTTVFERELFSLLERLYYNVNDVENTQGAYLHIINNSVPSASETILNSEISGNIVEILPMIANSEENRETMSKCVLRLNQPELALAYVNHNFSGLNQDQLREQFPDAYAVFSVCAMELGRWELIQEQVNEVKDLSSWTPFDESPPLAAKNAMQTFPAHLGSILANCRQGHFGRAKEYFDLAQVCATRSLFKTNAEGDRPYNMGFEFVQQLHSLADIQMAWPQLNIFKYTSQDIIELNVSLKDLLAQWEKHDMFISPNHREMEPILSVRRNILRSLNLPEQELKFGLTHLLVQSCKLARNDDLPYLVLPCLTEALKNGVSNIDIEEQRALYYFESLDENNRLLSIPTMNNAIAQFFPKCTEALQQHISKKTTATETNRIRAAARLLKNLPTFATLKNEEDCKRFVESAVLLLEMAQSQRETCVAQILKMYEGLEQMQANSEQFFYRYANFVDSTFKKHTDMSIRLMIRLCIATLKQGFTYAHELMPRIITIWLDTVPSKDESNTQPHIECITAEPSTLVLDAFSALPRRIFYNAFPLLVARLAKFSKKDKTVYNAIKKIMAGLIAEYPHQCALLSIGECRSTMSEHSYRNKAMTEVYQMAIQINPLFRSVNEAYKFIASQLMGIAANKVPSSQLELGNSYSEFLRYFQQNALPTTGKDKKLGVKVPEKIQIPLFFAYMDEPFKRISSSTVTITQLESKVMVMTTLARPKRLKMRASDGSVHCILCKPEDELRKDARFMDLARMLNMRSKTNKYTRNLGVRLRTFCVIPLQERGGIIEWVPNVSTMGECISQGTSCTKPSEYETIRQQFKNAFDAKKKLDSYYKLADIHPLKMSEFLRSKSTGPASYYQIQRSYTTSTAFMSSVGFIVGLGDRHTGNILIDQSTGELMHVDFCLLFNAGEKLNVPEKVPFRLTRNVVDGFGPIGVEGRYRLIFERTMSFIQQEKTAALACLKSFLHDPLIEWKSKEDTNKYDENSINKRIELVESRLNGYIHTLLMSKNGPFTVRGLVSKQIELAMDEKILSSMYFGWAPWI